VYEFAATQRIFRPNLRLPASIQRTLGLKLTSALQPSEVGASIADCGCGTILVNEIGVIAMGLPPTILARRSFAAISCCEFEVVIPYCQE